MGSMGMLRFTLQEFLAGIFHASGPFLVGARLRVIGGGLTDNRDIAAKAALQGSAGISASHLK